MTSGRGGARTIALDAMGGDAAPEAPLRAAAVLSRSTEIRLLLIGDAHAIEPALAALDADRSRIEIVHAPAAVAMHELPVDAAKRTDTSLAVAARAVADGRAEALVSAGNTGALLLVAARSIPRLRGVRRTALAAV